MIRLLLLLLLLFTSGTVFLFFQFNRMPVREEMLFLPQGGRGRITEHKGFAQSRLPDGSFEWQAWEIHSEKVPPNWKGWLPTDCPEDLLSAWLAQDLELQLVSGRYENYFYLAVLDLRQPEYKSLGFLKRENEGAWGVVSIDSIETLSGLDLFATFIEPNLQDSLERQIDTFRWSGLAPYLANPNTN
jgi:hypothetical protein